MGFWDRLMRLEDRIEPVRVGIVGDDSMERKFMESAYLQSPKARIVFSGSFEECKKALKKGDLELIEIFAPMEKRAELALECLDSGVNVSTGMPPAIGLNEMELLKQKAEMRGKLVRVRNALLYYEAYQKARELLEQEKIGYATMLKLVIKRKEGPGENFDIVRWILEKESDYISLAEYFYGPVEKIFSLNSLGGDGTAGSILLGFKFKTRHRFGYLLLDFAPELQIRTFTEPVFRQVWLTGTAGVIMVNRGEGQLWRVPVLLLRAKDYSHSWEYLKDQWEDIYPAMVNDVFFALRQERALVSGLALAERGMRVALAGGKSITQREEIAV